MLNKNALSCFLFPLLLSATSFADADVPAGFKVLGTVVPAEYDPPPTHGFTESAPQTHTGDYKASAEERAGGYVVYAKSYMDEVYPRTTPQSSEVTAALSAFSTPGEYEPVTFTIYALEQMTGVSVSVADLTSAKGDRIKASNIDVRSVRCWPKRIWKHPPVNEYLMKPWFLEKRPSLDIEQKTSQRFWLTLRVPPDTPAGTYKTTVSIGTDNRDDRRLALDLQVLDIDLMTPPTKQCIYYHMQDELNPVSYQPYSDPGRYLKDAVNMKEHGLNSVFMMIPVAFSGRMEGDKAVFDLDPIAPFMDACMKVGVDTVIFNMTLHLILPGKGPSADYGVNVRGFVDSFVARGWTMPILSYGDESDASDAWKLYASQMKMSKSVVPEAKTYTTIVYPWNSEHFEPHLDIRAHALLDWRVVEPARKAGRELWQYSGAHGGAKNARFYRGIWGSMLGLRGMSDWLYFLLYNKEAFLDDLGGGGSSGGPNHRGFVIPTPAGPLPTPRWEGIREGVLDGRYLYTLAELISKSETSGDPALVALAADAQSFLDDLYDQVDDIPEYVPNGPFPHSEVSGTIKDLKFFDFRFVAATHIKKMQDERAGP